MNRIANGRRVIQERDGGNNPQVAYTRGTDLSGTLEGAGGIGGLLARSQDFTLCSSGLTLRITNNSPYTLTEVSVYDATQVYVDAATIGAYSILEVGIETQPGHVFSIYGVGDYYYIQNFYSEFTAALDHHEFEVNTSEMQNRDNGYALCGADLTGNWLTHNYYHADGNGNVTYLESSLETLSASYRYDPFGNTISQSGGLADANVYRFSSKEIHAVSGLYYFGLRWYAPGVQRWLNRDPIGEEYDINLYRYVYNSPLNYVDPDGLWGIQFGDFNIGYGNPNLAFDSDSWDDIGQGAQATLDGIIPFGDPFMNNGGYDPCDKTLAASRALGQFARDIYGSTVALRGLARLGASRLPGTRWINSNRYLRFGNSGQPPAPTLRIGAARPPTPSNHIPLTLFGN